MYVCVVNVCAMVRKIYGAELATLKPSLGQPWNEKKFAPGKVETSLGHITEPSKVFKTSAQFTQTPVFPFWLASRRESILTELGIMTLSVLTNVYDMVVMNKFPRHTPEFFPCFQSVAISFRRVCNSVFFLQESPLRTAEGHLSPRPK